MEKFTQRQIAAWKRIAANVNADVMKRDKIVAKIDELSKELEALNATIEMSEAPVKMITGGYTTSDLLKKEVEDTGKLDKNGNAIKTTKYVLRYPETILPPTTEVADDAICGTDMNTETAVEESIEQVTE